MMYQFLNKVRKEGLLSVEMDVEKPKESSIFKNYPEFLNDHHASDFPHVDGRHPVVHGVDAALDERRDDASHGRRGQDERQAPHELCAIGPQVRDERTKRLHVRNTPCAAPGPAAKLGTLRTRSARGETNDCQI